MKNQQDKALEGLPLVRGNVRSAQRVCAVHVLDAQLWEMRSPKIQTLVIDAHLGFEPTVA